MTWYSCIASSSAAWVFGGVRLISSARMICAKIGPLHEAQRADAVVLVEDLGAGDVGRHQVRRELDALERRGRRISASVLISSVFASPGTPVMQAVAAGEQGDQHLVDDLVLPDDDLAAARSRMRARPSATCSARFSTDVRRSFHVSLWSWCRARSRDRSVRQRVDDFVDQHLVGQGRPLHVARVLLARSTTPSRRPCRCSS